MKKAKLFGLGAVALAAGLFLGACGNNGSTDSSGGKSSSDTTTAALITDTGGVDDIQPVSLGRTRSLGERP